MAGKGGKTVQFESSLQLTVRLVSKAEYIYSYPGIWKPVRGVSG